jgi:hypothetical protein
MLQRRHSAIFCRRRSIAFFLEVASRTIVSAAIAGTILSSSFSIPTSSHIPTFLLWTVSFDKGCVGKGQLTIGDRVELALNGIIVNKFFVPVIVGQFRGLC